jgi:hypothetical protein
VEVMTNVFLMGLVALNVTTMFVVMNMRSHMLRVMLRLMMLRMFNMTAVSHMMFTVMLRHFNLLN